MGERSDTYNNARVTAQRWKILDISCKCSEE